MTCLRSELRRGMPRLALALALALLSIPCPAQVAQITAPISGFITIPGNAVNVIVTNLYVTNVFITYQVALQPGTLTPLTGNLIDPRAGRRLVKTITAPTGLTIIPSFQDTNWATVYISNPNRFPVTWPSTNQVLYLDRDGKPGNPPDASSPFPIVLFESILGQIIATQ